MWNLGWSKIHHASQEVLFKIYFYFYVYVLGEEGGVGFMDAGRQIPERGIGSPGVRVTGGLESPNMSPGNRTWVL